MLCIINSFLERYKIRRFRFAGAEDGGYVFIDIILTACKIMLSLWGGSQITHPPIESFHPEDELHYNFIAIHIRFIPIS